MPKVRKQISDDADQPERERPSGQRLDESSLGIALLSINGRILQANQRLGQLIGAAPERLPGSSLASHLPAQLGQSLVLWLAEANEQPVRTSHRIATRNGLIRHLQFSVNKLPSGSDAAHSVVVSDLGQPRDTDPAPDEASEIDMVDHSIQQARTLALRLLESAREAHARAEAMKQELEREIDSRKRAEALLKRAEERYRRILEGIGGQE